MLWDIFFGHAAAFYLDLLFFMLALINTLIVVLKRKIILMEKWDNILILIDRSGSAKMLKPKIVGGRYIDLGRYGKIILNPEHVYRLTGPFRGNLIFGYVGTGVNIPLHLLGEAELARLNEDGELATVRIEDLKRVVGESFNPIEIATLLDDARIADRALIGEVREGMFKYLLIYAIVIIIGIIAVALVR